MSSWLHIKRHFCSAKDTIFSSEHMTSQNLILPWTNTVFTSHIIHGSLKRLRALPRQQFIPQQLYCQLLNVTWTCERSLSLNCWSTASAPSSLNSFKASIALSSRSLCATSPREKKKNYQLYLVSNLCKSSCSIPNIFQWLLNQLLIKVSYYA